jgi:hypothetical protein
MAGHNQAGAVIAQINAVDFATDFQLSVCLARFEDQ